MRTLTLTSLTALTLLALPSTASADVGINGNISAEISSSDYNPDKQRVSLRTYNVKVSGDRSDSRDEVMDKALYKAAKETLSKDYTWFRIVNRDTEEVTRETRDRSHIGADFERRPVRSCGLLTCSTSYETRYSGEIGTRDRVRNDTTYTVRLEYEMGTGIVNYNDRVYDARIVKNSYR